jgi:hypothetical protein
MKIQMSQAELFSLVKSHLAAKGLTSAEVDIAVVAGRKGNPLTVFIGLDEPAQEPKAVKADEAVEGTEAPAADQTDLFGAV